LEQAWSTLNTPFTQNSHHPKNRYMSASCAFSTPLLALPYSS
jgi:hypothetical protein